MVTRDYDWVEVIMNFSKSAFCVVIAIGGFQVNHIHGMMNLFGNKSRDTVKSVIRSNNDYDRQINIDRIAREYELSQEEVLKLEKTKIIMDHSRLVIPARKTKHLDVVLNSNDDVQTTYNKLKQLAINKKKIIKTDFLITSDYRAVHPASRGKSKKDQNRAISNRHTALARLALTNSLPVK